MDTVRWWAESPELAGWSAAGASYQELHDLAEEAIRLITERTPEIEHYVPAGERVPA